jgi:hypothetical protein
MFVKICRFYISEIKFVTFVHQMQLGFNWTYRAEPRGVAAGKLVNIYDISLMNDLNCFRFIVISLPLTNAGRLRVAINPPNLKPPLIVCSHASLGAHRGHFHEGGRVLQSAWYGACLCGSIRDTCPNHTELLFP